MRKLLFISPTFPFPEDKAWNVRISNLLKACSENFSVTLVAPQPEGPVKSLPQEMCSEFIAVQKSTKPAPPANFFTNFLKGFYDSHNNARGRYQNTINQIRPDEYDLIWVERRSQFACVRSHAKKIILDLDDIEHRKLWQEMLLTKWFLPKFQMIPRLVAIFLWEIFMTRFIHIVVVCSPEDKKYLERFGLKNVHVVPNGTSIEAPSKAAIATQPSKAVFLGNMGYHPNVDAIRYFDQTIIPLLVAKDPAFTLDVIGARHENISGLSKKINFLGYVTDLSANLQTYAVMVVPLRFGGGTKLKVLDAMASSVPIVTTSIGAEGLDMVNGVHAMVTDSPEDFAGHVLSLLENPALGNKLRANAYNLVMQNFSWKMIRQNTTAWLSSIA